MKARYAERGGGKPLARIRSAGCAAVMVELDHRVELVFTTPGEATIRVVGRSVVGSDFTEGEEFVVDRTVTVTP